jgi:hypothetical protein
MAEVVRLDLPFGDEGRMRAIMREMSDELAPRRFALWEVAPGWADARLVGWGYSDGEDTTLRLPREYHSTTLARLPARLRRLRLEPVWVDPEPPAGFEPADGEPTTDPATG